MSGARVPDVADDAFACGYVLGSEKRSITAVDLPDLRITGTKNGVEEASGVGSELMGSPLHALAWLARGSDPSIV